MNHGNKARGLVLNEFLFRKTRIGKNTLKERMQEIERKNWIKIHDFTGLSSNKTPYSKRRGGGGVGYGRSPYLSYILLQFKTGILSYTPLLQLSAAVALKQGNIHYFPCSVSAPSTSSRHLHMKPRPLCGNQQHDPVNETNCATETHDSCLTSWREWDSTLKGKRKRPPKKKGDGENKKA